MGLLRGVSSLWTQGERLRIAWRKGDTVVTDPAKRGVLKVTGRYLMASLAASPFAAIHAWLVVEKGVDLFEEKFTMIGLGVIAGLLMWEWLDRREARRVG
jgi:Sec-independent protein secretion pathway component TatC